MVECITTIITLLNDSTTVELEGGRACIKSNGERLLRDFGFDFADRILDLSPMTNFTHSLGSVMLAVAFSTSVT